MFTNISIISWETEDPKRVYLTKPMSDSYLYSNTEAIIEHEQKTNIEEYLLELSLRAERLSKIFGCREVVHIASPKTVREIESYLAEGFDLFPYSIVLPVLKSKCIEYVIRPHVSDGNATLYLASVMAA